MVKLNVIENSLSV